MKLDMSKKTPEQMKFEANEYLIKSKGFIIFTVEDDGGVGFIMDLTGLTPIEEYGLINLTQERTKLLNADRIQNFADEHEQDNADPEM